MALTSCNIALNDNNDDGLIHNKDGDNKMDNWEEEDDDMSEKTHHFKCYIPKPRWAKKTHTGAV